MAGLLEVLKHSIQITGFVAVIMLLIEYLNVRTMGAWQRSLVTKPWGQYILAAILGATPGCLGAFAVVALYSHRSISLGALVAAMLATAGDESFVMFAMFPRQALLIHLLLLGLGIGFGVLTDVLVGHRFALGFTPCPGFAIHETHADQVNLSGSEILRQLRHCSIGRGVLLIALALLLVGSLAGGIGPEQWNWIRLTVILGTAIALLIVGTVSDHFLEEHLWEHVALHHIPRIFLWTLGALVLIRLLSQHLDMSGLMHENKWLVLIMASVTGIIPESGPHLIFVTLYAQKLIPISVLLANSIVQDGHGALPLLAYSRRAFIVVKGINLFIALAVGGIGLALSH
ncbi:MAG TPA: putative manganese transporter [Armatimonadota bacterium]|nr:putative manganese transporter [Armatimonadota bacterium]